MAPGPAISGTASGKAAMLRTRSSIASSASCDWRPMRTPNTISEAIENSSRPPAMRKAGSEIDSVRSSQSPMSALPARMAPAIRQARQATLTREAVGRPWVMAMKVGTRPIGSTTTTRVTSAETRNSTGMTAAMLAVRRGNSAQNGSLDAVAGEAGSVVQKWRC